jgi:hypothetical protein
MVFTVAGIKVYVSNNVEEKFRRLAMSVHGYGRGSLSKAAEEAFLWWTMRHESKLGEVDVPKDPVAAIRGLLSGVGKSGVQLQHEARKIRAVKAVAKD